jgi:hypothetical protein
MGICYSAKMTAPSTALRTATYLLGLILGIASLLRPGPTCAQQAATAPPPASSSAATNAEFTAAADEVLARMSEITGLKLRTPLKKTLRSREEIHAYVIKQMNEEKNPAERYAGERSAEAFGLLPKGFDLDTFMVDLLTEQIAGLYDPQAHEFYIADWIPLADQRVVMAHELTHALQDQHFEIEKWVKAARPNDDAELARESVLEGSAMAGMLDYMLQDSGHSLKELPDIDPAMMVGDMASSPMLEKAPQFLKDALVFPYFGGLSFSVALLKTTGWSALPGVFAKPPASTQQIIHPEIYREGKVPEAMSVPPIDKNLGADWTKLEDNLMGEFGWKEILKQFLGEEKAKPLSAAWDGDRYALYEQKQTKRLVLVARLRLASEEQAGRFFDQYSEALTKKHDPHSHLFRQPGFLSFDTPDGGVFLRCVAKECLTVEGAGRAIFDEVNKGIGWPAAPETQIAPALAPAKTSLLQNPPASSVFLEAASRN